MRDGGRRPRRRPDGADTAQAIRPAAQGPGAARPRPAPAAGARAEDEAVRRGPGLRRRGRRPGGYGGLQPRVGGAGEPAADRGADRAGALGRAGAGPPRHPGLSRAALSGMAGPHPAVAQVRGAVRPGLTASDQPVLVACSGGADSLALAAAIAFEAPRAGVPAGAVTVDHGLQPGSAERAAATADAPGNLGLAPGRPVWASSAGRRCGPSGSTSAPRAARRPPRAPPGPRRWPARRVPTAPASRSGT